MNTHQPKGPGKVPAKVPPLPSGVRPPENRDHLLRYASDRINEAVNLLHSAEVLLNGAKSKDNKAEAARVRLPSITAELNVLSRCVIEVLESLPPRFAVGSFAFIDFEIYMGGILFAKGQRVKIIQAERGGRYTISKPTQGRDPAVALAGIPEAWLTDKKGRS